MKFWMKSIKMISIDDFQKSIIRYLNLRRFGEWNRFSKVVFTNRFDWMIASKLAAIFLHIDSGYIKTRKAIFKYNNQLAFHGKYSKHNGIVWLGKMRHIFIGIWCLEHVLLSEFGHAMNYSFEGKDYFRTLSYGSKIGLINLINLECDNYWEKVTLRKYKNY